MGSIAPYVAKQPSLKHLLGQLERFELCGDFMLTEIGHGLDARSIETTATLSDDGRSFDLHTPSSAAAKSMPPTTPLGNVPKIAVVFAQLIVNNESHGVRTFVVRLTEGGRMCRGISTKLLPQRPGTRPLDHALTWFDHVRLDRDCLLGTIDKPTDVRRTFFEQTHRVTVGGLALSLVNVPALKAGAYLAYTFSQKRMVNNPSTNLPVPILSFPTQYGPVISAAAHAAVTEAAGRSAISLFKTPGVPEPMRHAVVCVYKATASFATQRHLQELTERCGWRGMFAFNKISELQLALKGNSIAEGDVTVLCISKSSLFHPPETASIAYLLLLRIRLRTSPRQILVPPLPHPLFAARQARTRPPRPAPILPHPRQNRRRKAPLRPFRTTRHATRPRLDPSHRPPLRVRQCSQITPRISQTTRSLGVGLHARGCGVVCGARWDDE
jgi:acyl-CoA oxidase